MKRGTVRTTERKVAGAFRWCNRCGKRRPWTVGICPECGCPEFSTKKNEIERPKRKEGVTT